MENADVILAEEKAGASCHLVRAHSRDSKESEHALLLFQNTIYNPVRRR